MATQASAGAEALERKDYPAAIESYSAALTQLPSSPDYYIKRSTAYQRSTPPQYDRALRDAEAAVHLAHKRGRREAIAAAQMRRGIALFGLKRWADAGRCFAWCRTRNEKEPGLAIWERKVEVELGRAGEGSEGSTVAELPDMPEQESKEDVPPPAQKSAPMAEAKMPEGVQTPASKIRHEWYQTGEGVVVTLLAKGVPKDRATVEFHERSVSISFPLPTGSTFDFSLEPLFAAIDTSASVFSVLSTKIELVLKKVSPGQKWPSLEGGEPVQAAGSVGGAKGAPADAVKQAAQTPSAPSYPTSSRTGPKDWDKVAADLSKKPKKAGEDGDAEGDELDEDGDPVDGFFKKLYSGADADTRRAMIKSYQESNGTALSTNWSEVGKGRVETSPPEGMEARKWGQ
ncbi:MAG: hypothetical protein M1832_002769 [Thelocarpon impressellum]|nr:MAG: hypothetical protein M1832_002769 [Thelocarpon impressellum]